LLDELWQDTNEALGAVRTLGDLVVASYFVEDSERARREELTSLAFKAQAWLAAGQLEFEAGGVVAALNEGDRGILPFHWEIEFPEVFARENPGFDCFVGNPPFIGGTTIATRIGLAYHHALMSLYEVALGNADIVAFFVRRAFGLLRAGGTFGLITTNSVAQGDTRAASLQFVRLRGGTIYNATQRYAWPGEAAVIVALLHVHKGPLSGLASLNGRPVEKITSYLFHRGNDTAPVALRLNADRSSCGSQIMGAGFVFEQGPTNGSSSIEQMNALIAEDSRNREVIDAFMGGEEFNGSSTLSPSRYIINFRQMNYVEAQKWPGPLAVVEAKVKPMRIGNKQRNYREDWWLYASYSHEAGAFLARRGRMLVLSQVSAHLATAFVSAGTVYAKTLVLVLLHGDGAFAVIQSELHANWARFVGSSMKDDLRYTPSECFETFPFPPGLLAAEDGDGVAKDSPTVRCLELRGKEYYDHRAALMIKNNEGLTKTYNRFHNPEERSADILQLRSLHAQMDRAVLDAYGWTDILPIYDFREQLDESTRLTWAEDTRDEVLARLLELNRVMAAKEADEAKAAAESAKAEGAKAGKKPAAKKRGKKDDATPQLSMLAPAVDPKEGGGSI
jgi:hypothetical protein